MSLRLFSYLNDYNDNNLIERFQILENIYRTSLEEEFKAQIRLALEAYEQKVRWGWQDTLYYRVQNAKNNDLITADEWKVFQRLINYGNSGHHTREEMRGPTYTSKSEALIDFVNTLNKVYARGKNVSVRIITTRDLDILPPFFDRQNNYSFEYIDRIRQDYNQYLCRRTGDAEDSGNRYIIRVLPHPANKRNREIASKEAVGFDPTLKNRCLFSTSLFFGEESQVLCLHLVTIQQRLYEYVRSHGNCLDERTSINIMYQLSEILEMLLHTGNHYHTSICHRFLNPGSIIISTDRRTNELIVNLSCFEYAKVQTIGSSNETGYPNINRAYHEVNERTGEFDGLTSFGYMYTDLIAANADQREMALQNCRIMDIYSAARILIYMSTGEDNEEEAVIAFNTNTDFSPDFKQYIIKCLSFLKQDESFINDHTISDNRRSFFHNKVCEEYSLFF